jgi:hypothetical protein
MATVKNLTGLNDEQIDKALRWWARQPRKVQLRCIEKDQLANLVIQAVRARDLMQQGQAKRYDRDLEGLEETEKIRLEEIQSRNRKSSPKANAIYIRRDLIRRLRNQGAAWRDIATYLGKYSKVQITASYLRRIWNELEGRGMV